jgi:hypothetical protein
MRTKPCNLEHENTVIVQEIIDLAKKGLIATNTDMLDKQLVRTKALKREVLHTSAISRLTILVYAPFPPGI